MAAKIGLVVNTLHLAGWIPIRIYPQAGQLMVDWCNVGDRCFDEPFFNMTIHGLLESPFHNIFRHQTPMTVLEEHYRDHPGMKPDGFIFHMSHCGSTLIAQMLASTSSLVMSEPDPLEMLLRRSTIAPRFSDEQRVRWVRAMVSALGQRRRKTEQHYFIKFDSFPITQLPVLERAFPDVPWIFLYRNPIEVLAAIDSIPGCAIRGYLDPALVGVDYPALAGMSDDEYLVRLLAVYCECALHWHGNGLGKLINFNELPEAVWTSVPRHFGINFPDAEIARMQNRAAFNAKRPGEKFTSDNENKRHEAVVRWQKLAAQWLDPLYEQLEMARRNAKSST